MKIVRMKGIAGILLFLFFIEVAVFYERGYGELFQILVVLLAAIAGICRKALRPVAVSSYEVINVVF